MKTPTAATRRYIAEASEHFKAAIELDNYAVHLGWGVGHRVAVGLRDERLKAMKECISHVEWEAK